MSAYTNVGSQEVPSSHHPQQPESYVEEEDYLEPVEDYLLPIDQRGECSSVPHTYEDIDLYTAIAQPGSQSQPQYEEIPLGVIPPSPQAHGATPDRDDGSQLGHTGEYLESFPPPAEKSDRPARANWHIKWCVVGLVVLAVLGAAVGIGVRYTTGNGATSHCSSRPCRNGGTCFENVAGFTCVCLTGYSGDLCQQGSQVAFSAHNSTHGQATSWRRVAYRETRTDLGGAYHNSTFYSPSSDVYYVAMGASTGRDVSYRLVGAPHTLGLSYTSTNIWYRSLGRDCLFEILSQRELGIQFKGELTYGEWSMFSMTAAFHPLVAFTVTRTAPTMELGRVPFTQSLINTGGGFQQADSHFVAPFDGTYYFSVSAGVAAGEKARLHIVKNNERVIELLRTDTTHNGNEMISSAAIVKLSRGDRVYVELVEGSLYSDPEFKETSFSGLLYTPVHGHSIAWSVWRTASWNGTGSSLNPVPYDTVLVNEGGVYSTSQHVVTVPVSGVYCVHLSGGARGDRSITMYIHYGRSISGRSSGADILDYNSDRNGVTTLGQSALITVEAGDLVWVLAVGRPLFGLYSNPGHVTGFSGFLVYPT